MRVGIPCMKCSLHPSQQVNKKTGKASKTCGIGSAWREMNDERLGRDPTIDKTMTEKNVWMVGNSKGPYPTACGNVRGAYEYFTHKNDPDKYQYNPLDIKEFNGFTMELSSKEFLRIKKELANLILKENISEITEFDLIVRMMYQDDYYEVATNSTYYFNSLIKSLHHNKEAVEKRMKMIKGQVAGTVNKNQEEKDDESCSE